MLESLTILLVCQLAGEVLARLAGWPIPGPVVGMAPDPPRAPVAGTWGGVVVGVLHGALLGREWLPVSVALVASTVITIAVTGLVMKGLTAAPRPDATERREDTP